MNNLQQTTEPHKLDVNYTLFVNPNGVLCKEVHLFNKPLFTMIDVNPQFDGYDVNGEIINLDDWKWTH